MKNKNITIDQCWEMLKKCKTYYEFLGIIRSMPSSTGIWKYVTTLSPETGTATIVVSRVSNLDDGDIRDYGTQEEIEAWAKENVRTYTVRTF